MGTLVDFRIALRTDLNDPAGATQRFADADLNRAVTRAVSELTHAQPNLTNTELLLTASSRTIPLPSGTFPNLVDVDEIEYPYGPAGVDATYPPTLPPFILAAGGATLLLLTDDLPLANTRLRIRWSTAHSILEVSTTVPTHMDYLIARGAYGFACLAYSTPASDNFTYEDGATVAAVDDSMIPTAWRIRANEALAEFRDALALLRNRRALSQTIAWPLPDALREETYLTA